MRRRAKRVARKTLGYVGVVGGAAVAVNAVVSGPHAFAGGWNAVVMQCVGGLLLVGCGL